MFAGLIRKMMDAMIDSMFRRMMQEPYTENIFAMATIIQKLSMRGKSVV